MATTFSRRIRLAAALAILGPGAAAARSDVPVRQTVLPDGVIRYSVPITVGTGAPLDAELDTGSFGIRVLRSALRPSQYEATDLHRTYAFGGGTRFEGVLARAVLGVGPVRSDAPVLFHLIDRVGCVAARPECFASRVKAEDYRIAGDGYAGQGFPAILGLSMRRAATDDSAWNPLASIGDRSWILVLPRPGSPAPGHLVIDPDAGDRAGFAPLTLAPEAEMAAHLGGWADAALPGCIVPDDGAARLCGDTVLDSGAPGIAVGTDAVSGPRPWGAGRKARLEIGGAGGPAAVPFTSGADGANRVVLHPLGANARPQVSAGTLPFFSYAVLYDVSTGTMGFKARDPEVP